jgi:mannosyltransferase OCH1-like enzyme
MCGAQFDPIPRIIHQTWKTDRIPSGWQRYRDSWLRAHPDWEYRLWTDADNRALIAEQYGWFLPVYDAFPRDIQRVDAAKYFILYTHGGVYADLDCECLKPIGPVLSSGGAIVSRTRDGVIDGALLAAPPRHEFWELVFDCMQHPTPFARALYTVRAFEASHVLFTTGPRMMKRAVSAYTGRAAVSHVSGLTVCDAMLFSSQSWLDRYEAFDEPGAFVRHHYADSWLRPGEQRVHRWLTNRVVRPVAVLTLLSGVVLVATC